MISIHNQMNALALRLEDAENKSFPNPVKLEALNNAQVTAAQLLHNDYLTELHELEESLTVTAGVADLSSLNILRGSQGIIKVRDANTGLWAIEIDIKDVKKNENSLIMGTLLNPLYYVYNDHIYMLPTTITSIDVWYLKNPAPMYYEFGYKTLGGGAANTGFLVDTTTDGFDYLSETDNAYNRAVIYSIEHDRYQIIVDYEAEVPPTSAVFTLTAPSADDAQDTFLTADARGIYFLTHAFDQLGLEGVACELDASLNDVIVSLAEAECFAMRANLERRAAAQNSAYEIIKILNARYEAPEGIGTLADRVKALESRIK